MPFRVNAQTARYLGGVTVRVVGQYEIDGTKDAYLYAVNRTVRESKTIEWLGRPRGEWKNG